MSLKRSWPPKKAFEVYFEKDICSVSASVSFIYQTGVLTTLPKRGTSWHGDESSVAAWAQIELLMLAADRT